MNFVVVYNLFSGSMLLPLHKFSDFALKWTNEKYEKDLINALNDYFKMVSYKVSKFDSYSCYYSKVTQLIKIKWLLVRSFWFLVVVSITYI